MQHPDEGKIHAWLDGELPEDQANEIAAHANECLECSALVAEARGLIAASTRILTALDDVPAGVIPEEVVRLPAPVRRRRWYDRTDIRAAAALLIVAGASYLAVQRDSGASREALMVADEVQPAPAPAANRAATEPSAAAQKAVVRAVPPAVTSIAGAVKVTSKRGKIADSAYFLGEVSAAGATRAVKPAFGVVEGRVIDQRNDQGVSSANVVLPGTSLGANTDKDGRFSITNVPAGDQHLTVRRIGYEAKNIAVVVPDDASVTANVVLAPQTISLSQVVVTGVATAANVASPSLHVISVDSTKATRRTVYETSQGIRVTLAESPAEVLDATMQSLAEASSKVAQSMRARPAAAPVVNTISWIDHGRRYVLSGPLTTDELEALKPRLMLMRR